MRTTKLVVEYLVSGTLTVLALLLLTLTLFPIDLAGYPQGFDQIEAMLPSIDVILVLVFTAIAYAAGVIMEYLGTAASTRVLDRIKRRRLRKYIKLNADLFADDPLLRQFATDHSVKTKPERLSRVVGEMRYYVMTKDQALYADIALQISRLRLIRATFFVGLLVCISLSVHLIRSYSAPLLFALLLSIGLVAASLAATLSRLHRYCRCIEKAYKVLALAQSGTSECEASGARGTRGSEGPIR